jgi:metal-responsive CopG/Arc/MetJ family transcriptional regulator
MVYHMVMARKEILVQLDDELVDRLDELARHMGVSRSELLRRGAAAILEAAELAAADEALVRAYRAQPQDPLLAEAATRLASSTGDKW